MVFKNLPQISIQILLTKDDFKKLFSDQKIVKKSASAVLSGLSRRVD